MRTLFRLEGESIIAKQTTGGAKRTNVKYPSYSVYMRCVASRIMESHATLFINNSALNLFNQMRAACLSRSTRTALSLV